GDAGGGARAGSSRVSVRLRGRSVKRPGPIRFTRPARGGRLDAITPRRRHAMSGERHREITRRGAIQAGAGLAVGGVLGTGASATTTEQPMRPNVYDALGVKRVINAAGTFTALGGSVMPPEVVAAWADAAKSFVDLVELQDKVGEKIAKLL